MNAKAKWNKHQRVPQPPYRSANGRLKIRPSRMCQRGPVQVRLTTNWKENTNIYN